MAGTKTVVADSGKSISPEIDVFFKKGSTKDRLGELWYVMLLGLHNGPDTPMLVVQELEKGLPYKALTTLQRLMSLSLKELAEVTDIRYRTLCRRKEKGRLELDESDRLLRLTRIFGRALELFEGNRVSALRWLSKKQQSLDGATPLEMAKTEIGASEVERLISRLEHGVFT